MSVVGAGAYFINIDGQPEEEEEPVQPKGGVYLMKFDGVDGESKATAHVGWMILDSFTLPSITTKAGEVGSARRGAERQFEPLRITKRIDKSSPKLMDRCLKATVTPQVIVKYCRVGDDGALTTIMTYEFKNVVINGFHGSGSGEAHPTETISTGGGGGEDSAVPEYQPFFDVGQNWKFNRPAEGLSMDFEEIKVTYTEYDSENKSKGNVEFTWNLEEAEA